MPQPDLIPTYIEVCPEFAERWERHCEQWFPDRAGAYNDLAELAHFVVYSYSESKSDIVTRIFDRTERLLEMNDPQTTELVVIGLLEDIQTIATNRPFGPDVFLPYLGQLSRQAWNELMSLWKSKDSLMDVIRSEL